MIVHINKETCYIAVPYLRHNEECQKFAEYKEEYDKKAQYAYDVALWWDAQADTYKNLRSRKRIQDEARLKLKRTERYGEHIENI